MATLRFENICKVYDNKVSAVSDFNLEINDKEFIVFVGPSGCGKSTTLRMVAGLESITSGNLYIDDELVNEVLPKNRDIAMVFQSYALYPHMTVYQNMAFSLKIHKIPKNEIEKRVMAAAKILGLEEYLNRKPGQLSGGQCQRVALGRAIVRQPKVFLMDEPLSNLDAKLRVAMRSEIIRIHETVGATTIYVTHDQTEAMTMATRVVIMKDGFVQQIGTPREVFNNPSNMFVAGFIGSPAMNFIEGVYTKGKIILSSNMDIAVTKEQTNNLKEYEGKKVVFGVRPEDIFVLDERSKEYPNSNVDVEFDVVELLGRELILYGYLLGKQIVVKTSDDKKIDSHSVHNITFNMDKAHFFDIETTNKIA